MRGLVLVSAGTYHLPFERLGQWMEPWIARHPDIDVVVQHGTSSPVPGARNVTMVPHGDLMRLYDEADAIVLQGGAGGVMDARSRSRIPILVPRRPDLGEVVDRHQLEFARELAILGAAHTVETAATLHEALTDAVAGRLPTRSDGTPPTPGAHNAQTALAQLPPRLDRRTMAARAWRTLLHLTQR